MMEKRELRKTGDYWNEGWNQCLSYMLGVLESSPEISGRELARMVVEYLRTRHDDGDLGWVVEEALSKLGVEE